MSYPFLSDPWFDAVESLRDKAPTAPEEVADIAVNMVVTGGPNGDRALHFAAGRFDRGMVDGAPTTVTVNGLLTAQSTEVGQQSNELQAMLLKYAARCALRADQSLDAPPDASGHVDKLPGLMGLAPEWRDGTCDQSCQEKVSSCLIALINRTGKHVQLSLLSTPCQLCSRNRITTFKHVVHS
jgi:hypothetical protein